MGVRDAHLVPHDLWGVLVVARERGCEWVQLDVEGDEHPWLPRYEDV
jgi:hypothetical protein